VSRSENVASLSVGSIPRLLHFFKGCFLPPAIFSQAVFPFFRGDANGFGWAIVYADYPLSSVIPRRSSTAFQPPVDKALVSSDRHCSFCIDFIRIDPPVHRPSPSHRDSLSTSFSHTFPPTKEVSSLSSRSLYPLSYYFRQFAFLQRPSRREAFLWNPALDYFWLRHTAQPVREILLPSNGLVHLAEFFFSRCFPLAISLVGMW